MVNSAIRRLDHKIEKKIINHCLFQSYLVNDWEPYENPENEDDNLPYRQPRMMIDTLSDKFGLAENDY